MKMRSNFRLDAVIPTVSGNVFRIFKFSRYNNEKPRKMKATTTTLAAVLSLTVNFVFAGSDIILPPYKTLQNYLTPVVPAEATFEETVETVLSLTPELPAEATFEETFFILPDLRPEQPLEASFGDTIPVFPDEEVLSPVVPLEADFEQAS